MDLLVTMILTLLRSYLIGNWVTLQFNERNS